MVDLDGPSRRRLRRSKEDDLILDRLQWRAPTGNAGASLPKERELPLGCSHHMSHRTSLRIMQQTFQGSHASKGHFQFRQGVLVALFTPQSQGSRLRVGGPGELLL